MVRVKFRFRFSGIGFLAFVSGSKWVRASARFSPLGSGGRQADSQTLCLPQTKVWEFPPPKGGYGRSCKFSQKISAKRGPTVAFPTGWCHCPTRSRKSPHTADSGFTAGTRRLPALCQCRRVTQGTQDFGGGLLRHFAALASLFLVPKLQRMQFPSGK